ncbi:hypothetical protein GMRT_15649 [Giardia muris]|uniref:Coiled-coil protein n=1 Tax=Giardia muris TaxID=5742 RepID=A0A4Z1SSK4_GIAMU|nr:hypothetical protein GMRT_15649 [Giardia muris]|eukprot:TNJ28760.1 hypothetical protein GMRT_15649 [Giardia muris]
MSKDTLPPFDSMSREELVREAAVLFTENRRLQARAVEQEQAEAALKRRLQILADDDPTKVAKELMDLQADHNKLKEEHSVRLEELSGLVATVNAFKDMNQELTGRLEAKENVLSTLQAPGDVTRQLEEGALRLAAVTKEKDALLAELSDLKERHARLLRDHEDCEQELANYKRRDEEDEDRFSRLRGLPTSDFGDDRASVGLDFGTRGLSTDEDEDDVASKKRLEQLTEYVQRMSDELNSLRAAMPDTPQSTDPTELLGTEALARVEAIKGELEAKRARIHDLASRNAQQEHELSLFRHQTFASVPFPPPTDMSKRTPKLEEAFQELKCEFVKYKALEESLEVQRAELRERLEEVKRLTEAGLEGDVTQAFHLQTIRDEIAELERSIGEKAGELNKVRDALGARSLEDLGRLLNRKDGELDRLRQLVVTTAERAEAMDTDIREKERLLAEYRSDLGDETSAALKNENERLTREVNDLRELLESQGRGEDNEYVHKLKEQIALLTTMADSERENLANYITDNEYKSQQIKYLQDSLAHQENMVRSLTDSIQSGLATEHPSGVPIASAFTSEPIEVVDSNDPVVLRNALAAANQKLSTLQSKEQAQEEQIQKLQTTIKAHEITISTLQDTERLREDEVRNLNQALEHQEHTVGTLVRSISPRAGQVLSPRGDSISLIGPDPYLSTMASEDELVALRDALQNAEQTIAALREANEARGKEIDDLNSALTMQSQVVTSLCISMSPDTLGQGHLRTDQPLVTIPNIDSLQKIRALEDENVRLQQDLSLLRTLQSYLPGGEVYERNAATGLPNMNLEYTVASLTQERDLLKDQLEAERIKIEHMKDAMLSQQDAVKRIAEADETRDISRLYDALEEKDKAINHLCASLSPSLTRSGIVRDAQHSAISGAQPPAPTLTEDLIKRLDSTIEKLASSEELAKRDSEIERLKGLLREQDSPLLERTVRAELIEKEKDITTLNGIIERQKLTIKELTDTIRHREEEITAINAAQDKLADAQLSAQKQAELSEESSAQFLNTIDKRDDVVKKLIRCLSPSQKKRFEGEEDGPTKEEYERLRKQIRDYEAQIDELKAAPPASTANAETLEKYSATFSNMKEKLKEWVRTRPSDTSVIEGLFFPGGDK